MKLKKYIYFSLVFALYIYMPFLVNPGISKVTKQSDNASESSRSPFRVLSCIAWWSHDAVGYHPAMLLMLENISGQDLNGEEIPFQSRFTDLRDGYITVARDYKRTPVHNRERFVLLLRAPQSFELPIDSNSWPTMECKAMCRFAPKQGADAETDNLFVTHLSHITMSDEDAHTQLIAQAEQNPLLTQHDTPLDSAPLHGTSTQNTSTSKQDPSTAAIHENPLHQSSVGLSATDKTIKNTEKKVPRNNADITKTPSTKLPKHLPKVGDDFYTFEQLFGQAQEFQAGTTGSTDDLTWAHYRGSGSLSDIYAGSRNGSKTDVLMVVVSASSISKEPDRLSLAKVLAGCAKQERIIPFSHSVRYLPTGRSEIMTTGIRDRKILAFPLSDNAQQDTATIHKTVIFVTRLAGNPEVALGNYRNHVHFLPI